jgi:hypothetical protein
VYDGSIDAERLAEYRERGFVRLGPVLDAEELVAVRARVDAARERCPPGVAGVIVNDLWRQEPIVERVVRRFGRFACALIQAPRVVLFQDNLVWKLPGSARIEWHQDYSYQPVSGPVGATLWLSLDDADPASGCLHFVPGTHRLGERAAADFIAGSGQRARPELPPLDLAGRERDVVAVPTAAGELLAHHPLVWHMSPANASARHRRALSVNYLGPDVRWCPSQAPHPFNYALGPRDGDPFDAGRFPVIAR